MSRDVTYQGIREFTDEERKAIRQAVLRSGPGAMSRLIGQFGIDRAYLAQEALRAPEPEPFEAPIRLNEPLIDVFVEPDILIVVADLPGEDQDSIGWRLSGDTLTLTASGRQWLTVALPHKGEQVIEHRWRNGILTLQIARALPASILHSRAVGADSSS